MKWFITSIVLALCVLAVATPGSGLRSTVNLGWDQYPTNEAADAVIRIYSSTNISLPLTNWPLLAVTGATNSSIAVSVEAAQRWFVATASNYWGETGFSTVASVPAPPRSDLNLRIGP